MVLDHGTGDPLEGARRAAKRIAELTGIVRHDIAVVVGTSWAPALEQLGDEVATFPAVDVPGFHASIVPGHSGLISSRRLSNGRHALVLGSRIHMYEGLGVRAVAHGARTAAATGVTSLVLTNAAGGLNPEFTTGQCVLISDHVNLTGTTPLEGPDFVSMTDAYSARLRRQALEIDDSMATGIYAQFRGPQFETRAELAMARSFGADLVGMSTALETIAARSVDLEVLGLSLVTNVVDSTTSRPLTHDDVLRVGSESADRLARLIDSLANALSQS